MLKTPACNDNNKMGEGRVLHFVVNNVVSAAVESSLSHALLALGKPLLFKTLSRRWVFEVKQTEHSYFLTSELAYAV